MSVFQPNVTDVLGSKYHGKRGGASGSSLDRTAETMQRSFEQKLASITPDQSVKGFPHFGRSQVRY